VGIRKPYSDGWSRGGSPRSIRRVATFAFAGLLAVPASAVLVLASGQAPAAAAAAAAAAVPVVSVSGAHHSVGATQLLRPADVTSLSEIPNPAADVSDLPAMRSCSNTMGMDNSLKCTNAVLAYINIGRANDGIKPMVLPGNYSSLTTAQQLLVLINLERGDRGLPLVPGLCTLCDAAAQQGIVLGGDPVLDGAAFGSIWAGGDPNALEADFQWMYDDGWGGSQAATPNYDCTGPGGSGCWGHRQGILADPDNIYPGSTLYAGTAEGTSSAFQGWPTYDGILVAFGLGVVPPLDWTEPAVDLPTRIFVSIASTPDGLGYWLAASDGTVLARGDAGNYGSIFGQHLNRPIAHIVATADGRGYWLVASDGGIFSFGDARFYGSMGAAQLNAPVVDMAPTLDGDGYWLVASDGGIFSFGDAVFHGSMGGRPLNQPVVGIADDAATGGYWLVASDGGVFSFDATFHGSTGNLHLNAPITSMSPAAEGSGYWFVASDGGIFAFDAPFHGSMGGSALNGSVVGMASDEATNGYWMIGSDGGVFNFDAPFLGTN
jgi:hypothetical protein